MQIKLGEIQSTTYPLKLRVLSHHVTLCSGMLDVGRWYLNQNQ